jgi:glycosyltransferase involved in cell wall biosynthesis
MPVKSWTRVMTEKLKIAATLRAAIIVPHFNDTARLKKCLTALTPQTVNKRVQIIVVDNASSDDLTPLKAAFPTVTFLTETRKGAAAARNTGVLASRAENLFFLDADCIPAAYWAETALGLCGQDRIIGGKITLFDETPPPRSGAQAFEAVFAFPQKANVEKRNFSATANLLTTRTVFDDTGPFNGQVSEDTDWCQRAVARGWPIVYHNELRVAHPTRTDWLALRKKWRRITTEAYFHNGISFRARLFWAVRAFVVLVSGPLHAPRVLFHRKMTFGERARGSATLIRLRALRAGWMLHQALFGDTPRQI